MDATGCGTPYRQSEEVRKAEEGSPRRTDRGHTIEIGANASIKMTNRKTGLVEFEK
jgi:hypothetical protein